MTAIQVPVDHKVSYELSHAAFEKLRKLVLSHTGINLTDQKKQLVYSRFSKRLRALGLTDFDQYLDLLTDDSSDELQNFISAITTNFTSFLREPHHFEFLTNYVKHHFSHSKKLRIWSAGCSSGEEPYTIMMTLFSAIEDIQNWDIRLLATDLDEQMVAKASAGVYLDERIADIPKELVKRTFLRGTGNHQGYVKVRPEIQKYMTFRQLNLMHEWPLKGYFDIIFCRNVVIYFDKEVQRKLFAKFGQRQRPGDKLIIGHSENITGIAPQYKLIGKTIYERQEI